jgi:hypothetical protein
MFLSAALKRQLQQKNKMQVYHGTQASDDTMINKCGAADGMTNGRENRPTTSKAAPVSLSSPYIPGQVKWDLWWTKWHCCGSTLSTSVSFPSTDSTNYFTFINHL